MQRFTRLGAFACQLKMTRTPLKDYRHIRDHRGSAWRRIMLSLPTSIWLNRGQGDVAGCVERCLKSRGGGSTGTGILVVETMSHGAR